MEGIYTWRPTYLLVHLNSLYIPYPPPCLWTPPQYVPRFRVYNCQRRQNFWGREKCMYRLKSLYCCLCALLLVLSDNERNAVCLNTQKRSRLKGSFLALTYPMTECYATTELTKMPQSSDARYSVGDEPERETFTRMRKKL